MGRNSKLTETVVEKILGSIRLGETERYSCSKAGVSYEAFRVWRNKSPKHNVRVDEALEEWVNVHLANIDKQAKRNFGASIWRLKTRFPERFADPNVLIQLAQINATKAVEANRSPFVDEKELQFIRAIVDAQPNEIEDSPPPLEAVPDVDLVKQLERDRQQIEEWRHGPPKPQLMPPSDPPPPSEPVNPKLQSVRLPNQQELAAMREDAARAAKVQSGDQKRLWVAGKPTPESRGGPQPFDGVY
jgi:hypothetical protein